MSIKFPKISMRRLRQGAGVLTLVIAGITAYRLVDGYITFKRNLAGMYRINLNDSRAEVMYRLGSPPSVLGPLEDIVVDGKVEGTSRRVFLVDGNHNDINTVPRDRTVNDYQAWVYVSDGTSSDLTLEFDKAGRVEEMTCTAHGPSSLACGPLPHVWNGDDEGKVLKLGKPSAMTVDGVTKTIEYADLGVRYYLTKGQAYSFTLMRPKGGSGATLKRYVSTLLP